MDELKNRDELLKDLQFIKDAAVKNNNILKFISASEGIRYIALLFCLLITFFSLSVQWMLVSYGSFANIPDSIKIIFFILVGLSILCLVWLKINVFLKSARKYKNQISLIMLIKQIYTRTLVIIIIPFSIAIAAICIYFSVSDLSNLIIPVLSILISLLMVSIMAIMNLKDFLTAFDRLLISGSFSFFLADKIGAPILLILTFGVGMLILYISAQISLSREKRDKVGGR